VTNSKLFYISYFLPAGRQGYLILPWLLDSLCLFKVCLIPE